MTAPKLVAGRAVGERRRKRRVVAGLGRRALAVEPGAAGLDRLTPVGSQPKMNLMPFGSWTALPRYFGAGRIAHRRIGLRPLLVVDAHVVGPNHVALAVEHGGHPVGRAVRRVCHYRSSCRCCRPRPQARIGRVRVGSDVSVELVKVRLARLTRIQDRVVIGELTRAADEAEGADNIGGGRTGDRSGMSRSPC